MTRNPRLVVLPPQHLGHEIHVGRSIVVDMMARDMLCPAHGDCVMTGLPDRKFMYESLLGAGHVLDFSEVPGVSQPVRPPKATTDYLSIPSSTFKAMKRFSDFDVINLTAYALPPTDCTFGTSEEMAAVGYEVPDAYWTDRFIELSQQFNFLQPDQLNAVMPPHCPMYIVIHHRYSASLDQLGAMIRALPVELPKVVFTSNTEEIRAHFRHVPELLFTDDLRTYASLLRDSRCKLLISEWSGAGQVAQYTLGPQGGVWYYYDHYRDVFNFTMTHKIWERNARLGNYFNCWDFKRVSGCDIQHYGSFEQLLAAVGHIKVSHQHPAQNALAPAH
jgi:hypothetical protein